MSDSTAAHDAAIDAPVTAPDEDVSPERAAAKMLREARNAAKAAHDSDTTEAAVDVSLPDAVVAKPENADAVPAEIVTNDKLSRAWATVTRKESKLVQRERQLSERESAAKKLEAKSGEASGIMQELKADPVAFMNKHAGQGWYQNATQRFYNSPDGTPTTEDKVSALEKQLAEERNGREKFVSDAMEKWHEEQQQRQHQEKGANEYKAQLDTLIRDDDRFELTRTHPQGSQEVMALVNGYWEKHQKLLTPEQAASMIEGELEKDFHQLLGTKKAKSRLGVAATHQKAAEVPQPETTRPPAEAPNTLTNDLRGPSARGEYPNDNRDAIKDAAQLLRRLRRESAGV